MLVYLGLSAVAVFAGSCLLLLFGDRSPLASTHLVLAGAILPLIVGAIAHFVPVLTRSREPHRAVLIAPLLLQLAGILVFLHFSGDAAVGVLLTTAWIALAVCLGIAGWLLSRARRTLGAPHPGWCWYLAALALLAVGLALVPAMYYWPQWRPALRLLHLHLNTLGFIGLTAIGTLQVLLPTVLSGPDADAADRLRKDLPLAVAGVFAVGVGAALWWPLSIVGAAALLHVSGRLGWAWLQRYGWRELLADGASVALSSALAGFMLLVLAGAAHAFGVLGARDAVAAFFVTFLMPLVTGALSQLLPVWRYPGRRSLQRDRMREVLVQGGAARSLLFLAGGVVLAFGYGEGLWLMVLGLLIFAVSLVRAFLFLR